MKLKYTIVIETPDDCDSPEYEGYAPDMPGFFARGEFWNDDARRETQEALQAHIERLHENGEPIPTPKTADMDVSDSYSSDPYLHDDKSVGIEEVEVEIPPGARFS